MADNKPSEVLSSVIEALLAYQDTQEGLARVKSTASSVFGEDWRRKLPGIVPECLPEQQAAVKKNIDRALLYEQAVSAWTEAVKLLDPRLNATAEMIKKRLPVIQRPLSVFGQAGKDMFDKLQKRAEDLDAQGGSEKKGANVYGLTIEQLWSFDHFVRLKDYYDQTISRTSARCVHLGGLELSQYPYFGYILDLLDEIITFGQELVTEPAYRAIIQAKYKGGMAMLQKNLAEYKKEFEDNAPPEMLEEDNVMEDIRARLGTLAQDKSDGDIGPAPDGFQSPDSV